MSRKSVISPNHLQALRLIEARDYKTALKLLEADLAYSSDRATTLNAIGLCYSNLKRYEEAAKFYLETIKLEPNNWVPYSNLAIDYSLAGDYNAAEKYYKKAISIGGSGDTYYSYALNFEKMGEKRKAIRAYKQMLKRYPRYYEAHYNLGNILRGEGKIKEALRHYYSAHKINPDDCDVIINLASSLLEVSKPRKVISLLNKTDIAICGREDQSLLNEILGDAHKQLGNWHLALKYYLTARTMARRISSRLKKKIETKMSVD